MLVFHKIRYKNFISTGNQFIEIDFEKSNTNILVGKNGFGKCVSYETQVRMKNKKTGEIIETTVGEFYDFQKKQNN